MRPRCRTREFDWISKTAKSSISTSRSRKLMPPKGTPGQRSTRSPKRFLWLRIAPIKARSLRQPRRWKARWNDWPSGRRMTDSSRPNCRDDSRWNTGPAGFGANGSAPGLVLRTAWTTPEIWLRQTFEWQPDPAVQSLLLRMIHDDGFELFINGRQVLSRPLYSPVYVFYP